MGVPGRVGARIFCGRRVRRLRAAFATADAWLVSLGLIGLAGRIGPLKGRGKPRRS